MPRTMAPRSMLLDVPIEIRLSIYDKIPSGRHPPRIMRLNEFTEIVYEGRSVRGLAPLSRTCMKLHKEVKDIMCGKRAFMIHVSDVFKRLTVPSFYPNSSYVSVLRKVHVDLGFGTDEIFHKETLNSFVAAAESILQVLNTSGRLEGFTIAIYMGGIWSTVRAKSGKGSLNHMEIGR